MPEGQCYTVIKPVVKDIVTLANPTIRCDYVPKLSGVCLTNGYRLKPTVSVLLCTSYSVVKRPRAIQLQCESKKSPLRFSNMFFPNGWEIFSPNFTHLYYSFLSTFRLQIVVKLSPTVTKLCHY